MQLMLTHLFIEYLNFSHRHITQYYGLDRRVRKANKGLGLSMLVKEEMLATKQRALTILYVPSIFSVPVL